MGQARGPGEQGGVGMGMRGGESQGGRQGQGQEVVVQGGRGRGGMGQAELWPQLFAS